MTEKRKRIEAKIFEVLGHLDTKDGYNVTHYKDMFRNMSDEEFGKFCEWCNDPDDLNQLDHTLFIQALPFEEPSYDSALNALDALGVPFEEYVEFNIDGNGYVRSRYPIPVGYLGIKRMEQLLSKKNRYSLDNDERSIKTDQASGDSKVGAISDTEAAALLSHNADAVFRELYGARSGDEKQRNKMYKDIALNGYTTLAALEDEANNDTKSTLNTFNSYLLAAGIRTDLITNSLKLPITIKKELSGK